LLKKTNFLPPPKKTNTINKFFIFFFWGGCGNDNINRYLDQLLLHWCHIDDKILGWVGLFPKFLHK
jgi:hypothetical protein